tara:strand:- start:714 stop:1337 length:624 start_codon:yes stop_codon:yes gene_type:complete
MPYHYLRGEQREWGEAITTMYEEGTEKGDAIRKVWKSHNVETMSHSEKARHNEALQKLQKSAPPKALELMGALQQAVDDEDMEKITDLVFNVDDDNNLMSVLTDFIAISNESDIAPIKREYVSKVKKLSKAEVLARARDSNDKIYSFCDRCSRPMMTSWIEKHQQDTQICVEIRSGRRSSVLHQNHRHPDIIMDVADALVLGMEDDE